jgi:acetyl esterase/lipase
MHKHLVAMLYSLALALVVGSISTATAQEATPEIEMEQGVVYREVDSESLMLDVMRPATSASPRPAVMIFPSWGSTRISELQTALELAKHGYVAVPADYRMSWPEHIDDAQLAVRWLRANAAEYGVDPERVCALGASSGGQIAALLGVRDTRAASADVEVEYGDQSSRVTCAIDISGSTDLTIPEPSAVERQLIAEELGGTIDEAPEAYRDLSAVTFVDEQSAPFLIIHGNPDGTVPVEHARRLLAALQAAGIDVVYHEIPGASHFSGVDWETNGDLILAFLGAQLHPER